MDRAEIESIVEEYLSRQRGDSRRPKQDGKIPQIKYTKEVEAGGGLEDGLDDLFDTEELGIAGKPKEYEYTDEMAQEFGGEGKGAIAGISDLPSSFEFLNPKRKAEDAALKKKKEYMAKLRAKVSPDRILRAKGYEDDYLLSDLFDETPPPAAPSRPVPKKSEERGSFRDKMRKY